MNEELKIVIKAATTEAKKKVSEVRKEIEKVGAASDESSKSFKESMGALAKGAAAAVAAVAALTAAMTKLGKSAAEVEKGFSKLKTTFQSMGSSTAQATKTYKNLFGFLGEHDKAVEVAQSLALITTEEEKLAEWTKILQGAYATMGDKLPIEGLAEAANETIKVNKVVGVMADALNWMGVSEDAFNAALAQTTSLEEREVLVRNTLNSLYSNAAALYEANNKSTINYNKSQANLNIALAQATAYTTPLLTALNNLSTTFLTYFAPALQTVAVYLTGFIELIAEAIKWVSSFFGLISSSASTTSGDMAGYQKAMANYQKELSKSLTSSGKGLDENNKKIKELKKQTMGFDELNILSSNTDASASASGGDGGGSLNIPEMPNPADYGIGEDAFGLTNLTDDIDKAKEKIKGFLLLAGLAAAAFGGWKIANFISQLKLTSAATSEINRLLGKVGEEGFKKAFGEDAQTMLDKVNTKKQSMIKSATNLAGTLLIIAGAFLTIKGYSDAWANGIDWKNLGLMLGGIALTITGLFIMFGEFGGKAAGFGLIAAGIALIVVGIKDFVENGYSLEAVLTILAGVIAVVVGVCLAFNAALLANPITWIILAIAALVAGFVILWNECEGFRNFWIGLWDKIKIVFAALVEALEPLWDAIVGAFKEAWELIKVVWDLVKPYFEKAWEDIKVIWDMVKPYFEAIWNHIKIVFSVVKDVLAAYFKAAWEAIKIIWNQVVSYFTAIWNTIKGIFSVVKNVLSGNWKEAWEGIKGIVGVWGDYFKNTWENIKKIFSVVKTYFKEVFGSAWDGVKKVFANFGDFFDDMWNGIKVGLKAALNSMIDLVNKWIRGLNILLAPLRAIVYGVAKAFGSNIKFSDVKIPTIPRLAEGGIVNSSILANIGENGKEAVLPLENNTEWMDALADRIAARQAQKVILQVGERELGWATIGAINGITQQTGGLQLIV